MTEHQESNYRQINAAAVDRWVADGWEWGVPITAEQYQGAKAGQWSVLLTPTRPVPRDWFGDLRGRRLLGLACGGGQQMPIFSAVGARCTVMDISDTQLTTEQEMAEREGYKIDIIKADMTERFPFEDNSFDLIFHPVSNSYIEDVHHVWRECARVLKVGGVLLSGLDNGFNYLFDDDEQGIVRGLPFNPFRDPELYRQCLENDDGIQFSHTADEQLAG